ncbi:class I SAM-dependent methyltransferase [Inquilinus limosus]|uniref:class I SAM-dependent methyltransferase n=1 Tax=Inquilinus limosus TaxID=171674 RepID=UPI003F13C415
MSSATDRQWQRWGKENPYYGIVGIETAEFETRWRARFFETGKIHMDHVFDQLARYDVAPLLHAKALDFGCGAGRLLLHLVERFDAIVGVDVSKDQLSLARENIRAADLRLVSSLDELEAEYGTFDFVNTFVVLQHIRPKQGYVLIDRLMKLLRPGGAFAIHFTVGDVRDRRRRLNWFRYRTPPLHWAYNVSRRRPWNEPIMEMNKYDMAVVGAIMMRNDIGRFGCTLFNHTDNTGMLCFGRKELGINVLPQNMEG